MKRKVVPNIVRGGVAIPLKNNIFLLKGRTHEQGGIDIGRTLEAENNELIQMNKKDVKIFSSLPFLNDKSPAQRVMSGENPNTVFNAQESFKRRNKINDDGTKKKQIGGRVKPKFDDWYKTVPVEMNDTISYNLRRAYELLPYNELEDWKNGKGHLRSVAPTKDGNYEFLKSKNHPTYKKEIEWYNSNDGREFRNKYKLDDSTEYPKYIRRKKTMGGLSRDKDYGSKSKPYPSVKSGDFAGGHRSYPIPTKADARDALRLAGLHGRSDVKAKVYRKYPELRKKARIGGLYTLSVNGKQTLHPFPSTGEIKQSATADAAERSTMKYGGRKRMRAGGDETQAERARKYAEKFRNSIPNFASAVRNYKFDDPANHPPFQRTKPNDRNNSKPTINVTSPEITVIGRRRNTTNIRKTNITPANNRRTTSNRRRDNILANIQFRPDDRIGDFEAVDKSPVNKQNNSRTVSINRITPVSIANSESPSLIASIPNRQYQANNRLNTLRKITPVPIAGNVPVPTLNVTAPNVSADITASTTAGTRSNSRFRNFLRNNVDNIADGLGLLTNIGLSIVGRNINNRMLNSLRYTNAPIPQRAAKLKTRININPQLDRMRESLASYERNIDANTGSSQIALARKQRARLADVLGRNELYADKENKETELINTDRINQQEVANKNIEAYNNWVAEKAAFENSIAEQKANNRIAAINNINAGVQQIVSNIQQRMADQRTLAALTLGSPNLPAEMFYGSGIWNKRMYDLYRRSYPLKRK